MLASGYALVHASHTLLEFVYADFIWISLIYRMFVYLYIHHMDQQIYFNNESISNISYPSQWVHNCFWYTVTIILKLSKHLDLHNEQWSVEKNWTVQQLLFVLHKVIMLQKGLLSHILYAALVRISLVRQVTD